MRLIWKTEGPTDMLALASLGLPEGHSVWCNPFGATENMLADDASGESKIRLLEEFRGATVYVVHDCDQAGQDGATAVVTQNGRTRLGFAPAIAMFADEVRNVVLPYEITARDGKDLRDWINERLMAKLSFTDWEEFCKPREYPMAQYEIDARREVYEELLAYAQQFPIVPNPNPDGSLIPSLEVAETDSGKEEESIVLESVDDPYRLARLNLRLYRGNGRDLRYWNGCWYRYRNGTYEQISEDYLRARISSSVKQEFDRVWALETQQYEDWRKSDRYDADRDKGPPEVRKVTIPLVRNVLAATQSECVLPSSIEMPCWLEDRSQPHYLAMQNGLLDLDELERCSKAGEVPGNLAAGLLRPLSPSWFSTFALNYKYDPDAECEQFEKYIHMAMEGDPDRIALLQEWAGYLLTSTNDLQKFLCLEGEGGNGKTVFFAAMEAMLGSENVSHVPVENFGGRFDLGSTLGKAANICGDVGEIDQVAEGTLKQFTGGDAMFFDRKGVEPISARPSAKLMCAWNARPRFRDRSSGLWRRMLLIPFYYQVPKEKRVLGMDSRIWWEKSGEVPGILNWAIEGLFNLRAKGDFTKSLVCEMALGTYRNESNPASVFLSDHMGADDSQTKLVPSAQIYSLYEKWSRAQGLYPLNATHFFRELKKTFPNAEKDRESTGARLWGYRGIYFSVTRICEEDVPLFKGIEADYEGSSY